MTSPAHSLPCDARSADPAGGWLARIGRAMATAHRAAYVSHHALDLRLLADANAPRPEPTTDEIRDAWRLWFGGDPARFL